MDRLSKTLSTPALDLDAEGCGFLRASARDAEACRARICGKTVFLSICPDCHTLLL